jgi:hypothetical protein
MSTSMFFNTSALNVKTQLNFCSHLNFGKKFFKDTPELKDLFTAHIHYPNPLFSYENSIFVYVVNCKAQWKTTTFEGEKNYRERCIEFLGKNGIFVENYDNVVSVVFEGYQ